MSLFDLVDKAILTKSDRETMLESRIVELENLLKVRGEEAEQHLNEERRKVIAANHKAEESVRLTKYLAGLYGVDSIPQLEKQSPWPFGFFNFPKDMGVYYFNSSIIRFQKKLWICCRRLRQDLQDINDLVMFQLTDELQPEHMVPVILPLERPEDNYEDPRLFIHGKNLWVGSCNFRFGSYAQQCVSRLDGTFNGVQHIRPHYGKNRNMLGAQVGHEKNWVWFSHDKELHFIYQTAPQHRVVRFENGVVTQEYVTMKHNPLWKAGEPRGGTTPVRVNDEYWTFFHSSTPWKGLRRRYHMGAVAFQYKPPFELTRMTTLPLLTGSENDEFRIGMPPVVFPCGAIYENETWTVSMGVNDTHTAWVRIPHRDLLDMTREL